MYSFLSIFTKWIICNFFCIIIINSKTLKKSDSYSNISVDGIDCYNWFPDSIVIILSNSIGGWLEFRTKLVSLHFYIYCSISFIIGFLSIISLNEELEETQFHVIYISTLINNGNVYNIIVIIQTIISIIIKVIYASFYILYKA